jgi:hypothetical protein
MLPELQRRREERLRGVELAILDRLLEERSQGRPP